jgi:hypothetical protein
MGGLGNTAAWRLHCRGRGVLRETRARVHGSCEERFVRIAGRQPCRWVQGGSRMAKSAVVACYALAMVAVVVALDVLCFRQHFWARLMVNVGIVLVFGAFYLRFRSTF